ncbi:MAG: helix-turn-helix domain-containing protein [Comamonas sp.]
MSTIIMSACWPMQDMSAAQKAVLISLADQANDDGYCWPSVKTITMRTCLSARAVQGAIRWLESSGILRSSERRGTSTVYQLTPAAYAPPQEMHPADPAPHPRRCCTQTINEPSIEPSRN